MGGVLTSKPLIIHYAPLSHDKREVYCGIPLETLAGYEWVDRIAASTCRTCIVLGSKGMIKKLREHDAFTFALKFYANNARKASNWFLSRNILLGGKIPAMMVHDGDGLILMKMMEKAVL